MAKGSIYLENPKKRVIGRPRRLNSLAAVFMVFAVLLSAFSSIPFLDKLSSDNTGKDPLISTGLAAWCASPLENNIGSGMDSRKSWKTGSAWYPHSDSVRTLTTQEAFGSGVRYVNFHGTGTPSGLPWLWMMPDDGLPTKESGDLKSLSDRAGVTPTHANWESNLNSSRTPTRCFMGDIGTAVANGVLAMTTGVTSLMGGISTFAFDPNFICQPGNDSNCIDLVGIIGGSGSGGDDGILGKLTNSIYFPLLALAALLVGAWVMWNGLAKRQFRETFIGILSSVAILFAGVIMLLNPQLLAKAPMVIGNTFTSCIVGTFSGSGDCGASAGSSDNENSNFCVAKGGNSGNPMDQASITMTGMSCELWKAFVLQPYAQGSFGIPLDQLTTTTSGTIANKIVAANPGFTNEDFCVGTKTAGALDSYTNKTLDLAMGDGKICNLAVYQAYLGVDAKVSGADGGLYQPDKNAIDNRWLKVALFAASDDGMYNAWAPSDMHFAQIGLALLGLISALLAAVVVFVVSAFALAFYVTSILMVAFAPFFMLAGIHPGRGRKIMIGWIGQVLSNIMKYIASAIFLVITISLYSAVLSNVSNAGAILIFMIILTVALLMYRREIVDMIGVIDLGGEKLSNKFAEKTMDRVKNTGKTAMAVGAGVTAGVLSNGVQNPFSKEARGDGSFLEQTRNAIGGQIKHAASGVASGARAGADSGRRSIKSRPGMVGEVMKSSDRISADNRQKMAETRRKTAEEVKAREAAVGTANSEVEEIDDKIQTVEDESAAKIQEVKENVAETEEASFGVQARSDELDNAQTAALDLVDNPAIKEMQELLAQMANLEIKANIAAAAGNDEESAALEQQQALLQSKFDGIRDTVTEEEYAEGRAQFNQGLADNLTDPRVTPENVESYQTHVRDQYEDTMKTLAGAQKDIDDIKAEASDEIAVLNDERAVAVDNSENAEYRLANAQAASEIADESMQNLRAGKVIRSSKLRKQNYQIDAQLNDQRRNLEGLAETKREDLEVIEETAEVADKNLQEANAEVNQYKPQLARATAAKESLTSTRNLLDDSKSSVIDQWEGSNDVLESSAAKFARAEMQNEDARARLSELQEIGEDNLTAAQRRELFDAKTEINSATSVMNTERNKMDINGGSAAAIDNFKKTVAETYNGNRGSQQPEMRTDLSQFEAQLDAASASVDVQYTAAVDEKAQLDDAAAHAAKLAMLAKKQAEAARTAVDLAEKGASNRKPVSERDAERIKQMVDSRMPTRRPVQDTSLPAADEELPLIEDAAPVVDQRTPDTSDRRAPERAPETRREARRQETREEAPAQNMEPDRRSIEDEDARRSADEAAYLAERQAAARNSASRNESQRQDRQPTPQPASSRREDEERARVRAELDEAAADFAEREAREGAGYRASTQNSPQSEAEKARVRAELDTLIAEQQANDPVGRRASSQPSSQPAPSSTMRAEDEARARELYRRGEAQAAEQEKADAKAAAREIVDAQKRQRELDRLEQAKQQSNWNEKKEQSYQNKKRQLEYEQKEAEGNAAYRESQKKFRAETAEAAKRFNEEHPAPESPSYSTGEQGFNGSPFGRRGTESRGNNNRNQEPGIVNPTPGSPAGNNTQPPSSSRRPRRGLPLPDSDDNSSGGN